MRFTNYFWVAFVLWPVTVQAAALANMLIWLHFSGTELILDWFVGVGIGTCFWLFTNADPQNRPWWKSGLMVFTQGIFGLLGMTSLFPSIASLFWWSAGSTVGATVLASALDHAAIALGGTMTAGGVLLSVLLFLLKAPFCLCSTAIGLLIFIAGLFHQGSANAGAGFLGGVLYEEWDQTATPQGVQATTVGATVHCWRLRFCQNMCHELNHSRQCIYMHDLMIPTWVIGFAVTGGQAGEPNPVESVAYDIQGPASVTLSDSDPCVPCSANAPTPTPTPAPKPAPTGKPKPKPKP
jgi:hypothetical protein